MGENTLQIDKIEGRLALFREKKALFKIDNRPFFIQIQEKGDEVRLKRVEKTQRWTMQSICKKKNIPNWKDEFCLFWDGFLKGEHVSINDYLYIDRLAPVDKRVLKNEK